MAIARTEEEVATEVEWYSSRVPVEQLDAALAGIREECVHLIGAGKKVILQ